MNAAKTAVLVALVVFLSSCASVRTEGYAQEATAHFRIGVAYLNDNKVQQAFVEFHKAYDLDPNNKEVLNAIGIVHMLYLDEPLKGIEYFERASKVDPEYSEAYNNLGFAHEKLGNYDQALSFYKQALANPRYLTAEKAYINMGNVYYRLRKYDSAVLAFKEAIKRDPQLSIAYMRLALCYNAMGKYGDAASAMTQAINVDPYYKGNREKAIDDLTVRKFRTQGAEEQDISDYLEILRY